MKYPCRWIAEQHAASAAPQILGNIEEVTDPILPHWPEQSDTND